MTQINLNPYVNSNLQAYTNGLDYPAGGTSLTVGGIGFTLANHAGGGTGIIQTPSQSQPSSFDVAVSVANPNTVYALMNSTYGAYGATVGSIEFKATGGLDFSVNLAEGQDLRDHNNYEFNNTIGRGALGGIYLGTASFGGGQVRLDKLGFTLPASFQKATLTDIILHGSGEIPIGCPFLAAATVATGPSAAQPTLTALRASTASAAIGQSVTLTATVGNLTAGGDIPNGSTVTFSDRGGAIGTGTVIDGVASLTTSSLPAGTLQVTASYGGTSYFASSATGTIETIAGNGTAGYSGNNGLATAAELNSPWGIAIDTAGDLFIADGNNNVVREVVKATGDIITVAGNGTAGYSGNNGPATAAELNLPNSVAVDSSGDLFITDENNNRIREVVKGTGAIVSIAGNGTAGFGGDGGPATAAEINSPRGISVDAAGDVFFSDILNRRIREVVEATGHILTVAGDGTAGFGGDGGQATAAELNLPTFAALDPAGDLFITDQGNNRIREVVKATGLILTVAGNGIAGYSGDGGQATAAELNAPNGVAVDFMGDLFIGDVNSLRVREVIKATGDIITVAGDGVAGRAGDGGPAIAAELDGVGRVAVDSSGDLFIADNKENVVREVTPAVTVTIGPSSALPTLTALSASTTSAAIGESVTFTATVRDLSAGGAVPNGGTVTFYDQTGPIGTGTLVGGVAAFTTSSLAVGAVTVTASYGGTANFAPSRTGTIVTAFGNGSAGYTGDSGPAAAAEMNQPIGMSFDSAGNLFIADYVNNVVREVIKSTGIIITVAGDGNSGYSGDGGPATAAELSGPDGVVVDAAGNLFISENFNNVIREAVKATGNIITVAGNGTAGFTGNNGPATAAELHNPHGLAIDSAGNLFIADSDNYEIRELVKSTGNIIAAAGDHVYGYSGDNGPATAAQLSYPFNVTLDSAGDLFIADTPNNRVREVIKGTGAIITVAGNGIAGYSGDNGSATAAELHLPYDVALDSSGDLFIVDNDNSAIREVVKATGRITTVAGNGAVGYSGDNGPATAAELNNPCRLAIDSAGELFISDSYNNVVREITTAPNVTINVGQIPAISWPSPSPITYGTALGGTQLDATASFGGSTLPGTFTYTPAAGTILGVGTRTLSVTFIPTDTADYQPATAQVTLLVHQATPAIHWPAPLAITYGNPLGAAQLDATASVPGTFAYTPAAGTVLHAGLSQVLSVTFTPTDSIDYSSVTATALINVLIATSTSLSISSIATTLHQPLTLSAAVSAPAGFATPVGSVTFFDGTNPIGSATLNAAGKASLVVSTLGLGQHSITAAYTGNSTDTSSTSSASRLYVGDQPRDDFDGDGKADVALFDRTTATFSIQYSGGGSRTQQLGNPGHVNIPVAGDYDGDGKTDLAIYDQTAAVFYILESGGINVAVPFGNPGHLNIPVAGDYDGGGKTDIAIYDQTAAIFYIVEAGGKNITNPYGNPGHVNIPVAGDYDGGGKTDVAIYDQTASVFYIVEAGGRNIVDPYGNPAHHNIPLAGDFDGDGKTDVAIYDQTAAVFYVAKSGGGNINQQLGPIGDASIPIAGDFDGDGKADLAIYDTALDEFFVQESGGGSFALPYGIKKHANIPI